MYVSQSVRTYQSITVTIIMYASFSLYITVKLFTKESKDYLKIYRQKRIHLLVRRGRHPFVLCPKLLLFNSQSSHLTNYALTTDSLTGLTFHESTPEVTNENVTRNLLFPSGFQIGLSVESYILFLGVVASTLKNMNQQQFEHIITEIKLPISGLNK